MCLYIKKFSRIRTATKDIKCFKFVDIGKNGELKTPYQSCVVEIGKTYNSEIRIEKGDWTDKNRKYINIGLHSLLTVDKCIELIGSYNIKHNYSKVISCIIPKGSRYINGVFDGICKSYVSDTIIYVDEVIIKN